MPLKETSLLGGVKDMLEGCEGGVCDILEEATEGEKLELEKDPELNRLNKTGGGVDKVVVGDPFPNPSKPAVSLAIWFMASW